MLWVEIDSHSQKSYQSPSILEFVCSSLFITLEILNGHCEKVFKSLSINISNLKSTFKFVFCFFVFLQMGLICLLKIFNKNYVRLKMTSIYFFPQIGLLLDDESYEKRILPCIIKLFSSNDRSTRIHLLQQVRIVLCHRYQHEQIIFLIWK